MTIKTTTCALLVCDAAADCDWEEREQAEGFVPHFDSPAAALAYAADCDWQVDAENRLTCPYHVTAALCAAQGHDWGSWHLCCCNGRIVEHQAGPREWEWRVCSREHCPAREERQSMDWSVVEPVL